MTDVHDRTKRWQRCVCYTIIVVYGIVPLIALVFPAVIAYVTLGYSIPFSFADLKDPSSVGLKASRYVDLTTPSGHSLGLWHILPESTNEAEEKGAMADTEFDSRLASGAPVFIYAHGSGGSRAQFTRLNTYLALRGQNWHVVTFDYRGFADSTGEATEVNMVEDAMTVYHWVKKRALTSPVFLWGHSLGTGVVVEAARLLSSKNDLPDGIVLEGSFNNLYSVVENIPLLIPYRPFTFYMQIFQDALKHESLLFSSDQHLPHVLCPTLLLHAEDDMTIPLNLARQLYKSVESTEVKGQPKVTLHVFPADKGYGHNGVNQAPDLGSVVKQFVLDSQKRVERKS